MNDEWIKNSKAFNMFTDELLERVGQLAEFQDEEKLKSEELVNAISGAFHKTKGAAGMFGFSELADVSFKIEKLFGAGLREVLSKNLESKALIEQFKNSVEQILNEKV